MPGGGGAAGAGAGNAGAGACDAGGVAPSGGQGFEDAREALPEHVGAFVWSWSPETLGRCDVLRRAARSYREGRSSAGERVSSCGGLYVWGVDVLGWDTRAYGVLRKFVAARRAEGMHHARELFLAALRWRDEYLGDDGSRPLSDFGDEPAHEPHDVRELVAEAGDTLDRLSAVSGRTAEGHQLVVAHYGALAHRRAYAAIFGSEARVRAWCHWRVRQMEAVARATRFGTPGDKMLMVHDLHDLPVRLVADGKVRKHLARMFDTLNACYPEFTVSHLLIRASAMVRLVVLFVKPFVRPGRLRSCKGVGLLEEMLADAPLPDELRRLSKRDVLNKAA